jgi:membrane-bound serine protease (ClpP class)
MRKLVALIISLIGLLGVQTSLPAAETSKHVFIIPIREDIDPPLVYLVRRGVKEAMEAKADLIILDIDTNGGRIDVTKEIIAILDNFKGDTVAYVHDSAYSAGAFISFEAKRIYMAPGSVIGAAAPVMAAPGGGTQDIPTTVETKHVAVVSALARGIAEKNGHNKDVIEAMVDRDKELVMDGKTIKPKGKLLALTNTEAEQEYGDPPKPLLSSGTVASMDALLEKLGYTIAQSTTIQPTGAERLGTWITTISPLLMIIGILGIYLEVKIPGAILPGVTAVFAFLLYFLGAYIAGLSGMEWVIVFIVGLALVISELFLHPGTILPGVAGAVLIFVALVMAMVDMYPGTPVMPQLPQLRVPLENLTIALVCSMVIVAILARVLPKTSVYSSLVSHGASGVTSVMEQEQQHTSRIGQKGVAVSTLRPGGKAQFGNEILDVITQGEMIPKGQAVRIIRASGAESVVESVA